MNKKLFVFLLLTVLISGCTAVIPVPINVQVKTDKTAYKIGDEVKVTINNSGATLYSLDKKFTCGVIEVEKKQNSTWAKLDSECKLGFPELIQEIKGLSTETIKTNGSSGLGATYDALTSGRYRIKLRASYTKEGEAKEFYSDEFEITS